MPDRRKTCRSEIPSSVSVDLFPKNRAPVIAGSPGPYSPAAKEASVEATHSVVATGDTVKAKETRGQQHQSSKPMHMVAKGRERRTRA